MVQIWSKHSPTMTQTTLSLHGKNVIKGAAVSKDDRGSFILSNVGCLTLVPYLRYSGIVPFN